LAKGGNQGQRTSHYQFYTCSRGQQEINQLWGDRGGRGTTDVALPGPW